MNTPFSKRLNKFISEKGICSRREADRFIEIGRVYINGQKAKLGDHVHPGDKVMVNGIKLEQVEGQEIVLIALNKPVGIVSTTELTTPDNIVDFVNYSERVFPIGRLDKDSQGLILLTNNGDIVNKILRSGNKHEKEYLVTVDKPVTEELVKGLAGGVPILGEVTKKCKVEQESSHVLRMVLIQGKNRQIRRMCDHFGYQVTKLERIRIMNITLKGLPQGDWRVLTPEETEEILKSVQNSSSEPSPRAGKRPRKPFDGEVKVQHTKLRPPITDEDETGTEEDFQREDGNGGNEAPRRRSYDKSSAPEKREKRTYSEYRKEGARKSDGDERPRSRERSNKDFGSKDERSSRPRRSEGEKGEYRPDRSEGRGGYGDRKTDRGPRDNERGTGERRSNSSSSEGRREWSGGESRRLGGRFSDSKGGDRPERSEGRGGYGGRKSEGGGRDGERGRGDRKSSFSPSEGRREWSGGEGKRGGGKFSDNKGGSRPDRSEGRSSYGDRKSEGGRRDNERGPGARKSSFSGSEGSRKPWSGGEGKRPGGKPSFKGGSAPKGRGGSRGRSDK